MVEPREWLIRKDGYFYRPDCAGYTTSKFEAGRYTKAEAEREAQVEPWHMSAVHQDEWPDDPPSAAVRDKDAEIFSLTAKLAQREQELAEARAERDALASVIDPEDNRPAACRRALGEPQ